MEKRLHDAQMRLYSGQRDNAGMAAGSETPEDSAAAWVGEHDASAGVLAGDNAAKQPAVPVPLT
eukprot:4093578-Pleurochrysis_carterae.AAC.1